MAEFAATHAAGAADDVGDGDPIRPMRATTRPAEGLGPAVGRVSARQPRRRPPMSAARAGRRGRRAAAAGARPEPAADARRGRGPGRASARSSSSSGATRTAAFDAAITLRIQASRNRALDAPDGRRVVAGLPAAEPDHPAASSRALAAVGLRLEALFQALGLGDGARRDGRQGGSCAGPGRWPARTCGWSPRRSVARASRAATSSPTSASYGFLAYLVATLLRPVALAARSSSRSSWGSSRSSGRAASTRATTGSPT